MRKKLRRSDLPNATNGLDDRRRKREFRALIRTSESAYISRQFKERRGPRKRFFPTPVIMGWLARAVRFQAKRGTINV
jgi:hypothetical protein